MSTSTSSTSHVHVTSLANAVGIYIEEFDARNRRKSDIPAEPRRNTALAVHDAVGAYIPQVVNDLREARKEMAREMRGRVIPPDRIFDVAVAFVDATADRNEVSLSSASRLRIGSALLHEVASTEGVHSGSARACTEMADNMDVSADHIDRTRKSRAALKSDGGWVAV